MSARRLSNGIGGGSCMRHGQAASRCWPLRPRLRPQRGRPSQPRRATADYDVPASEWLPIPVPPLVDAGVFATVQEQVQENRRHARQARRGARYLLQGLVHCQQCGYAFYGKPVSRTAAKGKTRTYAYYRCLGTDAYRFGGERVCTNRQDEAAFQTALHLIIGRLEDFATKIHAGLDEADWLRKREMIRALVKRVEVTQDQVNVVFRIDSYPGEANPEKKSLQLCRGSDDAT